MLYNNDYVDVIKITLVHCYVATIHNLLYSVTTVGTTRAKVLPSCHGGRDRIMIVIIIEVWCYVVVCIFDTGHCVGLQGHRESVSRNT